MAACRSQGLFVLHLQAGGERSHPSTEFRDSMGSFHQLLHPDAVGFSLCNHNSQI